MKIKFKKEYPDVTRWPDILLDFLDYLGEKYYGESGGSLDEYDLLGIVWQARMKKLAPLVEKDNAPATNLYKHCASMSFAWHDKATDLRNDYRDALEVLMPKKEGIRRWLREEEAKDEVEILLEENDFLKEEFDKLAEED